MRPTSNDHNQNSKQLGFTLIELIVVITITAILAATAAKFITNPLSAYYDIESRANLTDRAETALRIIKRQVRNAVPNTLRVTTGVDSTINNSYLEFMPIKQAGRYRASQGTGGAGDALDFTLASDTFDVLGSPIDVDAGDQLVINNLGVANSNVYQASPDNMRPLSAGTGLTNLNFSGGTFSFESPSSRFYITNTPITYACDMTNKKIYMYSHYPIQTIQPVSIAALNALSGVQVSVLAENISACAFNYAAGVTERTGIIGIMISMEENDEKVRLMHQVNVYNTP